MTRGDPTFALSYRNGAEYFFIPTVPPARDWRGPYPTESIMQRAMRSELGDDVAETRTVVRPGFLNSA
jgi:hypothetical protein